MIKSKIKKVFFLILLLMFLVALNIIARSVMSNSKTSQAASCWTLPPSAEPCCDAI